MAKKRQDTSKTPDKTEAKPVSRGKKLIGQIIDATVNEGYQFRLSNGLDAKMFRFDNPKVNKWSRLIQEKSPKQFQIRSINDSTRDKYYITIVLLEKEEIGLVHFQGDEPDYVLPQLQNPFSPDLDSVRTVVFRGRSYSFRHPLWPVIANAIKNKTSPEVSRLLSEEKKEED